MNPGHRIQNRTHNHYTRELFTGQYFTRTFLGQYSQNVQTRDEESLKTIETGIGATGPPPEGTFGAQIGHENGFRGQHTTPTIRVRPGTGVYFRILNRRSRRSRPEPPPQGKQYWGKLRSHPQFWGKTTLILLKIAEKTL